MLAAVVVLAIPVYLQIPEVEALAAAVLAQPEQLQQELRILVEVEEPETLVALVVQA